MKEGLDLRIFKIKQMKSGEKKLILLAMYRFEDLSKLDNIIEFLNSISKNKIKLRSDS